MGEGTGGHKVHLHAHRNIFVFLGGMLDQHWNDEFLNWTSHLFHLLSAILYLIFHNLCKKNISLSYNLFFCLQSWITPSTTLAAISTMGQRLVLVEFQRRGGGGGGDWSHF